MTLSGLELEELHLVRDRATGLVAVIAIHDRSLGPARGGTRLREDPDLDTAAREAARLARAMTYKFAVHGLPFGGGKAVIVQDAAGTADRSVLEARLLAYGRFVERLAGEFGTGPDLGTGEAELKVVARATAHVAHSAHPAVAGAATAAGVRASLELALERTADGLERSSVAVQGLGAVGGALAEQLAARGARVLVADARGERAEALRERIGAEVVDPAEVTELEVDAFAPCATGDVLTPEVVAGLRCRVVAGAANDQLAAPELERARALQARGILYVPDFVANGGAAVALTRSEPLPDAEAIAAAEAHVRETLVRVLDRAEALGCTPWEAALGAAEEALARARVELSQA